MRRQRLSRLHLLLIVSLSLVIFSARLTWTQETSSASKTPKELSIPAMQLVTGPEAGIRFNPAYEKLSLPFAPNQGQAPSLVRFRPFDVGYLIGLTKNDTSKGPWQLTNIVEPQVKPNQFSGNAPTEWLTGVIPQETVYYSTTDRGDALQYYSHRVPWAGRIILEAGKQAESHPRVFRVFEFIRPGLSLGKPTYPRWLGR